MRYSEGLMIGGVGVDFLNFSMLRKLIEEEIHGGVRGGSIGRCHENHRVYDISHI